MGPESANAAALPLEDNPDPQILFDEPGEQPPGDGQKMDVVEPKFGMLPDAQDGGAPDWAIIPPGLKFPRGRQVIFLRLRAAWTDAPSKGERQVICWSINIGDKKLALQRAGENPNKFQEELTKQMIRAIDGKIADWSGKPGEANIDIWWDEIGERCRSMLDRIFIQLHVISREDSKDFFENCVAVRVAGG